MEVIPGIKYGIRGELIPSCRSVSAMLQAIYQFQKGIIDIKLPADITDDDQCQRGPDGKPEHRMTPMVPYSTKAEWTARG